MNYASTTGTTRTIMLITFALMFVDVRDICTLPSTIGTARGPIIAREHRTQPATRNQLATISTAREPDRLAVLAVLIAPMASTASRRIGAQPADHPDSQAPAGGIGCAR